MNCYSSFLTIHYMGYCRLPTNIGCNWINLNVCLINYDDDIEGKVNVQHMDAGELLASYNKQGNVHYVSIISIKAWGAILFKNLKFFLKMVMLMS